MGDPARFLENPLCCALLEQHFEWTENNGDKNILQFLIIARRYAHVKKPWNAIVTEFKEIFYRFLDLASIYAIVLPGIVIENIRANHESPSLHIFEDAVRWAAEYLLGDPLAQFRNSRSMKFLKKLYIDTTFKSNETSKFDLALDQISNSEIGVIFSFVIVKQLINQLFPCIN